MHQIYPKSGAHSTAEAKEKFSKKIEKSTKKMGAELISYNADSGVWMFRVGHFSRYGLDDDDSDEEDESVGINTTPSLATIEDDQNELGGASKFRAPNEDESTTGSFTDDISASEQLQIADDDEEMGEDAYAMMTEELVEYADALELQQFEHEQAGETLLFPNEAEADNADEIFDLPIAPVMRDDPSTRTGICNQLLNKVGLTKTSIDYGLRMRRSFRVGKTPKENA
jgi:hypothetical protein